MIPIAMVNEDDTEASFNGLAKIKQAKRRKLPLAAMFDWIMNHKMVMKLTPKSRPSLFNSAAYVPMSELRVCSACRLDEPDEISLLTLFPNFFVFIFYIP